MGEPPEWAESGDNFVVLKIDDTEFQVPPSVKERYENPVSIW